MRVLVTDSSGYWGETVVRKLRERGDDLRVFDLVDNEDRPKAVEFLRGDIRDVDAVRSRASGSSTPASRRSPREGSRTVLVGQRGRHEDLVRSLAPRRRREVVLVSSSAIYGVPPRNSVDLDVARA